MTSDSATPTTQKAWMVVKQGKPGDALALKTDVPVPKLKNGEVLVRVRAAALNPVGWKVMNVVPNWLSKRPHPAEHDLAGVVVDGNGTSFEVGDQVIGFVPVSLQFSSRRGALAQYVALPEDHLVPKPAKLTWEEAAGVPLVGLTAVQALRLGGYDPARALAVPPSRSDSESEPASILINGGSTSVGIYAVQLAKCLSLRATATASPRNRTFVSSLGADEVLDYATPSLFEALSGERRFGMVLDAAGVLETALYARSGEYVRRGGRYVTTGPWPDERGWTSLLWRWAGALLRPAMLGGAPTAWRMVNVVNDKEDMRLLCALIERGALRPCVDSTYEFESALDAYDRLMTGRATGKVIVKVD